LAPPQPLGEVGTVGQFVLFKFPITDSRAVMIYEDSDGCWRCAVSIERPQALQMSDFDVVGLGPAPVISW
jgi:hypothetical protein